MYLPTRLPETETRDTETSDPVAITLLRAAQIIRERGWCQEKLIDMHGRVCAVGAISAAARSIVWLEAAGVFKDFLRQNIDGWNDTPGRTADEVIVALECAAAARIAAQ